jgi:hypothetical protein
MKRRPPPGKKKSKTKRPARPKALRAGFKPIHDGGNGKGGNGGNGGNGKSGGGPMPQPFPDPWTPDVAIDMSFPGTNDPTLLAQKLESLGFQTQKTANFGGLGFFLLRVGVWFSGSANLTQAMVDARTSGLSMLNQGVTAANTLRIFLDTNRVSQTVAAQFNVPGIDLQGHVNPKGPISIKNFSMSFSPAGPTITTSVDASLSLLDVNLTITDTLGVSSGHITNSVTMSLSPDVGTDVLGGILAYLIGGEPAVGLLNPVWFWATSPLAAKIAPKSPGNSMAHQFNKVGYILLEGLPTETTFTFARLTSIAGQTGLQVGGGWANPKAPQGTASLSGPAEITFLAANNGVLAPYVLSIQDVQEPIVNWSVNGGGSAPPTNGEFQLGHPTYSISNNVSFDAPNAKLGQVLDRTIVVSVGDATGDPAALAVTPKPSFKVKLHATTGRHGGK